MILFKKKNSFQFCQIKCSSIYIYKRMKLLNTIQNIIKEAEEQYNIACDSCVPVEELDRLEKHYKDSLKLLKLYQSEEKKKR